MHRGGATMRSRILSPSFFKHGELYDAEKTTGLPTRLAFAGLWCIADRAGRFVWRPRELKLDILPYDDCDFAATLDALEAAGFIRSYVVEGKRYGVIPSFPKHQTFHHREAPSKLPPEPGETEASTNEGRVEPRASLGLAPEEVGPRPTVSASVSVTASASDIKQLLPPGGEHRNGNGHHAYPEIPPFPAPAVKRARRRKELFSVDAQAVLEHYRARHPSRRAFTPKNLRLVERSLGDYTVAQLIQAIDGNADDDWHKDKAKHELAYVFREGKIDDFIAKAAKIAEAKLPILQRDPALAYAMGVYGAQPPQ